MFDLIAEQKIAEAIARGELDHLPGAGRPLELDDDALVPEDLRIAVRILKNAGLDATAVKKLGLMKVRIEARYYGKLRTKLAR
jgi:Domain of unknown function (DUF1992)